VKAHFDYKFMRANVDALESAAKAKNMPCDVRRVATLYDESVALQKQIDAIRAERNTLARNSNSNSNSNSTMTQEEKIARGRELKAQMASLESTYESIVSALECAARQVPNLFHPSTPIGDESANRVVKHVGALPSFPPGFQPRDHVELARRCDLIDFDAAALVSGNRFYYLRNEAALLELALVSYATQFVARRGFTPHITPDLVRQGIVEGCGFQPRSAASQLYAVEGSDLCLTATAEIPLAGLYANRILAGSQLPARAAAFGRCFRTEIGHAGSENRGIYRVHQFSKVEMFAVCQPAESDVILEQLRQVEEELFASLELPFRVLEMASGELGAPAYRKYDMEGWMPGKNGYGEISSASNCTDYQARRLNIRMRSSNGNSGGGELQYAHTLNGTACAVPRTIICILENHQRPDGSIGIPAVLQPFMMGITQIEPRIQEK
jgi:seryl-tRNA synthetase